MAKKLNKNLVIALTAVGFVLTTVAGILMVYSFQQKDPADFARKAQEYADAKDWDRASLYYRKAYQASEDPTFLVKAGDMVYESGEEINALAYYQNAANIDPLMLAAQKKILDLRLELAQGNPSSTEAWTSLGAVADAILGIDGQADNAQALYAKGLALVRTKDLRAGNEAQGLTMLKRAVDVEPDHVEYVRALAAYYAERQQVDQAAKLLEDLVSRTNKPGEDAAKSRCYYATYLRSQKQYDDAVQQLDEATKLAGDDPEVQAYVYAQIGMFWMGRWAQLSRGEPGPDDPQTTQAFDKAESAMKHAIEVEPKGYGPYLQLAMLYSASDRYDDAIAVCNQRLQGPTNRHGLQAGQTRVAMYRLYLDLAEYKTTLAEREPVGSEKREKLLTEAEMHTQDALAEIANGAQAHHRLGRIRYAQGKDREAIQYFERAEALSNRIDPMNLYYLARGRERQGQYGAARDAIRKAVAMRDAPLGCWLLYGRILLRLDDTEGAIAAVDRVLQRDPKNADAQLIKAAAMEQSGETDVAREMLSKIHAERPVVVAAKAATQSERGDPQGALEYLTPYLEKNPTSADLVRAAVLIYNKLGRDADAQRILDAAVAKADDPYPFEIIRLQISDISDDEKYQRQRELIDNTADQYVRALRKVAFLQLREKDSAQEQYDLYAKAKQLIDDGATPAARRAGERGRRAIVQRMFDLATRTRDTKAMDDIVADAEKHNVDGADGLSFSGRRMVFDAMLVDEAAAKESDPEKAGELRKQAQAKYDDAINVLIEALDRFPNSGLTHAALGSAYYQTKRYNEAKIAFERADDITPDNPMVVRQLAVLAQRLGDEASFRARIAKCGKLIPNDPWVKEQLLRLEEAENPQEGIAKREKLREQDPKDVSNLLSLAGLYRQIGDADKCADTVAQLLKVQSDGGTVAYAANLLRSVGKGAMALDILKKHLRDAPPDDKPAAQLLIGRHYQELRDFRRAESAFLGAADLSPTADVCLAIAGFYYEMREYSNAKQWYDRAYDATQPNAPQRAGLRRAQIECLLRMDQVEEAAKLTQKYRAEYPDDSYALFYESQVAGVSGKMDEALDKLGRFIEKNPRNALARYRRAQYLASRGDWQQAITDLENLRATNPKALSYAPRVLLSRAYAMAGQSDLSVQELENVIKEDPDATPVAEELINQHISARRYIDAERVITAMTNRHPNQTRWLIRSADLAMAQMEQSKKSDERQHYRATAIRDLKQAVKLSGFDEQPTYRLLAVLQNIDAVDEGIKFFEERIPPNRRTAKLLSIYARLLARRGDLTAAADSFRFALLKSEYKSMDLIFQMIGDIKAGFGPDGPKQFSSPPANASLARANEDIRATLEMADGKTNEAVARFTALLADAKSDAEKTSLLFRIGLAYDQGKQFEKAKDAYEKVLDIDENYQIALNNLAYLLSDKLHQPQDALVYAQRAALLDPTANVLDTLGWTYVQAGQVKEGIGKLTQARQSDSTHVPATYHLGEAYRISGNFDNAVKLLTEAAQSKSSAWSEYKDLAQQALQKAQRGESG